jgi:hypothetical protein
VATKDVDTAVLSIPLPPNHTHVRPSIQTALAQCALNEARVQRPLHGKIFQNGHSGPFIDSCEKVPVDDIEFHFDVLSRVGGVGLRN